MTVYIKGTVFNQEIRDILDRSAMTRSLGSDAYRNNIQVSLQEGPGILEWQLEGQGLVSIDGVKLEEGVREGTVSSPGQITFENPMYPNHIEATFVPNAERRAA